MQQFSDLKFHKFMDGIAANVTYGEYELSVVQHSSSYGGTQGLYEIAVFFEGEQKEMSGITREGDTVKGFLTEQEVDGIMLKMMALTGEDGVTA